MAKLNKDGLEPGKPVDFETLMKVKHQKVKEDEPAKPKTTRKKPASKAK